MKNFFLVLAIMSIFLPSLAKAYSFLRSVNVPRIFLVAQAFRSEGSGYVVCVPFVTNRSYFKDQNLVAEISIYQKSLGASFPIANEQFSLDEENKNNFCLTLRITGQPEPKDTVEVQLRLKRNATEILDQEKGHIFTISGLEQNALKYKDAASLKKFLDEITAIRAALVLQTKKLFEKPSSTRTSTSAATTRANKPGPVTPDNTDTTTTTGNTGEGKPDDIVKAPTEFGLVANLSEYADQIMKYALPLGIVLAIIMCMYAGVVILWGAGSPELNKTGTEIIQGAIIGLVVLLLSRMIVDFLVLKPLDYQSTQQARQVESQTNQQPSKQQP